MQMGYIGKKPAMGLCFAETGTMVIKIALELTLIKSQGHRGR
jgi:hypothetical protein